MINAFLVYLVLPLTEEIVALPASVFLIGSMKAGDILFSYN